jgi:hypothetical protein
MNALQHICGAGAGLAREIFWIEIHFSDISFIAVEMRFHLSLIFLPPEFDLLSLRGFFVLLTPFLTSSMVTIHFFISFFVPLS